MRRLYTRARAREEGFGLIELLIAMTILVVGLLAILAAFSSGITAMSRASRVGTASTLADSQMQLYRALTYCNIRLDDASYNAAQLDSTYTSEYNGAQVLDTTSCGGSTPTCAAGPPKECNARRSVTGPDRRSYRVDTYIVSQNATGTTRPVKKVTVVVRDTQNWQILARHVSVFEQLLG